MDKYSIEDLELLLKEFIRTTPYHAETCLFGCPIGLYEEGMHEECTCGIQEDIETFLDFLKSKKETFEGC